MLSLPKQILESFFLTEKSLIVNLGEWDNCTDSGVPTGYDAVKRWVKSKNFLAPLAYGPDRKFLAAGVGEGDCYLVKHGTTYRGMYSVFRVVSYEKGQKVVLEAGVLASL